MSEEPRDLYYHDPFHDDRSRIMGETGHSFFSTNSQGFDPSNMSFTECLHGSTDYNTLARVFGLSPSSSSEPFSIVKDEQKPAAADTGDLVGGNETPVTPNSSALSSSTEACDEEVPKGTAEDGGESPKKVTKQKKKAEKKEKEPRFAFLTKSEVDHLEDGYRWRKYGQKAVKNSPYPRSYYRCTTQKCTVKKRVERSYQDPSIVMTTYEGTHNHHLPATLRGNVAGMFPPSMLTPTPVAGLGQGFPQELIVQMPPMYNSLNSGGEFIVQMPQVYNINHGGSGSGSGTSSIYQQTSLSPVQQQHQLPDFGLLQDMVPSMFFKQEP